MSAAHRIRQVLDGRVRTQSSGLPVAKELDVDRLARNAWPKRSEVLRSGRRMAPVHGTYMNIQFSQPKQNVSPIGPEGRWRSAVGGKKASHDTGVHALVRAALEEDGFAPTRLLRGRPE